jgi:hypothetical protein
MKRLLLFYIPHFNCRQQSHTWTDRSWSKYESTHRSVSSICFGYERRYTSLVFQFLPNETWALVAISAELPTLFAPVFEYHHHWWTQTENENAHIDVNVNIGTVDSLAKLLLGLISGNGLIPQWTNLNFWWKILLAPRQLVHVWNSAESTGFKPMLDVQQRQLTYGHDSHVQGLALSTHFLNWCLKFHHVNWHVTFQLNKSVHGLHCI